MAVKSAVKDGELEALVKKHNGAALDAKPKRPSRADETRRERRRRRPELLDGTRQNLHVSHKVREDAEKRGMELRWIKNTALRMEQMTQIDDWDVVEGVAPKAAGNRDPDKMILVEKPKEWCAADRAAKQRELDRMFEGIKRDKHAGGTEKYHRGDIKIIEDGRQS